MSNTTIKYQKIKKVVSDVSWNPFAKYLLNPNSKYGGFALSFHEKIDKALDTKDNARLRAIVMNRPDFPEIEKVESPEIQKAIRDDVNKLAKDSYYVMREVDSKMNVKVIEPFSRVDACFRKEPWAQKEFPIEFEFAKALS